MSGAIHCEIVKALAYGKTRAEIRRVMKVSEEEIDRVTAEEVAAKREQLRKAGYIR